MTRPPKPRAQGSSPCAPAINKKQNCIFAVLFFYFLCGLEPKAGKKAFTIAIGTK